MGTPVHVYGSGAVSEGHKGTLCRAALVTATAPAGHIAATVFPPGGAPVPLKDRIPPFDPLHPFHRNWHRPLSCPYCARGKEAPPTVLYIGVRPPVEGD